MTVTARTTTPQHLHFDPTAGALGVDVVLPPAGTLPGDLPTLNSYGFPGPSNITHNGQPVHNVFQPPTYCFNCHGTVQEIYPSYMGSMMANSGRDPMFFAQFPIAVAGVEMLHQNGLSPIGGEVAADFCIRCHMPAAWQGGRSGFRGDGITTPFEPDVLDRDKALDIEGVSCDVCHRAVDFVPNTSPTAHQLPGQPDSSQLVFGTSLAKRGPYPGTHRFPTLSRTDYGAIIGGLTGMMEPPVAHVPGVQEGTAVSPGHDTEGPGIVGAPELCASCHNITNPLNGHAIERTYTEWLDSDFGDPTSPDYQTCQECHMPAENNAPGCSIGGSHPVYGSFMKLRSELRKHEFAGGNSWIPQVLKRMYPNVDQVWRTNQNYTGLPSGVPASRDTMWDATSAAAEAMLKRAAWVDLAATETTRDTIDAVVTITNRTGHKLPTGYPEGRQMWVQVEAFDANDNRFYVSGDLDPNTALVRDADLKVYEAKQGLNYPLPGFDRSSFHFVLNNAIYKDNRIPPKGGRRRPGTGGNDSYDPVLAPWPTGGLYPDNQHWDDTAYTITVPAGTARPVRVRATVYYQSVSYEYINFLAAGGDNLVSTLPHPDAIQLKQIWDGGFPCPPVPVGEVGTGSTADPNATHTNQSAHVILP